MIHCILQTELLSNIKIYNQYVKIKLHQILPHLNTQTMFSSFFKKYLQNHVRKTGQNQTPEKLNVTKIFNKQEQVTKSVSNKNLDMNKSKKRIQQYNKLLQNSIVNIQKLKDLAWDGIPQNHRSTSWRLLLKYMPTNKDNQEQSLARKRRDYFVMVDTYIQHPTLQQDAQQKKIFKLINDDVIRTLPESTLFRNQRIQKLMRRVLYVWHMRHPASGYVQGINDVVTPFILVFLSDYIAIDFDTLKVPEGLDILDEQKLKNVQGDSYWTLSKLLDRILDNYTSSWPGIQKSFMRVQEVIKRVDPELLQHFKNQTIDFYHMYFKWVTCLLLRQFTMKIGLRLYDTYLSDQTNYFSLCLFILSAIILKFSKKFKKMSFQEMMIFQQNMPTKEWDEEDLSTVIAQAYVYKNYFLK